MTHAESSSGRLAVPSPTLYSNRGRPSQTSTLGEMLSLWRSCELNLIQVNSRWGRLLNMPAETSAVCLLIP
jgi:hypothetical protein